MARIRRRSAKAKGRRLQKEVCRRISELVGLPWGKDSPIESRPMGQSGVDVRLDRQALRRFPFSVECKAQENWSVQAWIEQASDNRRKGTDWILVAKKSHSEPVVIIEIDLFFRLLGDLREARRSLEAQPYIPPRKDG